MKFKFGKEIEINKSCIEAKRVCGKRGGGARSKRSMLGYVKTKRQSVFFKMNKARVFEFGS